MLLIPVEKLRETLISDGVVTEKKFETVLSDAKRMGQTVPDILISQNIITKQYYENILSKFYNVPITSLDPEIVDTEVINLLPEDFAKEKRLVPFRKNADGSIDVAMEDPSNLAVIEYLKNKLKTKIKPFLASSNDLSRIFAFYGKKQVEGFKKIIQENIQASLQLKSKKDSEAAVEVPIISITDNLISYAATLNASDIHIEALEKETLVRYRIDGILHEVIRIQKEIHQAIVARFKILGKMKLDEHTSPQDGRFRYKAGGKTIDIRISILPTLYGEKVELRLLSLSAQVLSFEELGMRKETIQTLTDNVTKSYGMVLVTGPTGSGKSTTLYSILNLINKPEVNIITVEDPIEYDMKYINQTQINETAGVSFATALRAILRQDPNIIMVGEIRDEETAEISIHAALTGHLLLSSLHTNDAPTAVPRLSDMKVAPFLVAAVLNVILAQRLLRRICLECMHSYTPSPEIIRAIQKQIKELNLPETTPIPKTFFKGKGCAACGKSGYKGRMGIFETLEITEEIRSYIADPNFRLSKLRELAQKNGMKSMFEDGLIKAGQGNTTIEEILRVIRE